jgi:hypothetical protein
VKEDHAVRLFESKMLRKIFSPTGRTLLEAGENYVMRSLIIFTLQMRYHCQDNKIKKAEMGLMSSPSCV